MSVRIAIIGAGPSGLAQLCAFQALGRAQGRRHELVCYEKQGKWGGLWNYTWRTGLDEYGEPVHGSMYRQLWSNGPKESVEFADYSFEEHFGRPLPSYPPRAVLLDYVTGRAKRRNLLPYIRVKTVVRWVTYLPQNNMFAVTVKDLVKDEMRRELYDYVIVASGHFSTPYVPYFDGLEAFSGRVMHAHDFRNAREFSGKRVLIVGASYSAEDIGIQCHKFGAKSVVFSHRKRSMGFIWPTGFEERPLLQRLIAETAHFVDGSASVVDVIILCTGYLHYFPFLPDDLRLKTANRLYPLDLYKGVFWRQNPRLIYLGMQDQYFSFNMFDAQAWYARDVITGSIELPSPEGMDRDMENWQSREKEVTNAVQAIDFQRDYIRDLLIGGGYPLDVDRVADLLKTWELHKVESIMNYRDHSFTSTLTGVLAPAPRTCWMEAFDDSLADFVREL